MYKIVCYKSSVNPSLRLLSIVDLFDFCKKNNEALDITGFLIKKNNQFFQVIEGQTDVINPLFARIKRDNRHHKITTIFNNGITERIFKNFSTEYHTIEKIDTLFAIKNYMEFLRSKHNLISAVFCEFIEDIMVA